MTHFAQIEWQMKIGSRPVKPGAMLAVGDRWQDEHGVHLLLECKEIGDSCAFSVRANVQVGGKNYLLLSCDGISGSMVVARLINADTLCAMDADRFSSLRNALDYFTESGMLTAPAEFEQILGALPRRSSKAPWKTPLVIERPADLPAQLLQSCRKMPYPQGVLMCPPDYFDVIDVKNPHMAGNVGNVDREKSFSQWQTVHQAFSNAGARVDFLEPLPNCEDMVFCANQTFVGWDANDSKLCVLAQMKYPSRQLEVPSFKMWFERKGYRIEELPLTCDFEGSGDAVWHPGRALIWGGVGTRTQKEAYEPLSRFFDAPVIVLPLLAERFYHLDTCFCAIDEETVLIHVPSFSAEAISLVRAVFKHVIECDDEEAAEGMACNATALFGKTVVIQKGNLKTKAKLLELGYDVVEVDTSEFMKSGGSVFCMKMYVP